MHQTSHQTSEFDDQFDAFGLIIKPSFFEKTKKRGKNQFLSNWFDESTQMQNSISSKNSNFHQTGLMSSLMSSLTHSLPP